MSDFVKALQYKHGHFSGIKGLSIPYATTRLRLNLLKAKAIIIGSFRGPRLHLY